jgi:hypothetical protein
MASRSSGSGSTIAWMVIMGVLGLGGLIFGLVMYNQRQAVSRDLASVKTEVAEFVRDDERRRDDLNPVREAARAARQSVVGYLNSSMQTTMERVTGARTDRAADLDKKLAALPGAEGMSLVTFVSNKLNEITELERRIADADAARKRAEQDRENEVKRIGEMQGGMDTTVAALTSEVNKYKDEIDSYRDGLTKAREDMSAAVERIEAQAKDREVELNNQIADLQREVVLGNDTIKRLQFELRGKRVQAGDEAALVDASVIGIEGGSGQVYLNVGRRNNVVLGMTFQVYSDASGIRPDPATGEYPEGKAAVEVIKVDETSSTARIVREKRGNPVVRGDVAANAAFDPNKQYTFLVFGNFDPEGTGRATPQGRAEIEALITGWGGRVIDELSGDVDFVVLGRRPTLPPQPRDDAPPAVITEYIRQQRIVQQYDRLFQQATSTSIPVLNENRLYTLTGKRGAGR